MQLSFRKDKPLESATASTLLELQPGESGVLDRLDLPPDVARRLMELGFLPGHTVSVGHSAPGGDPRVFRVDGSEIALRLDTASHLFLRSRDAVPLQSSWPDRDCP